MKYGDQIVYNGKAMTVTDVAEFEHYAIASDGKKNYVINLDLRQYYSIVAES